MAKAVAIHVNTNFNTNIAANLNLPPGKKRIFVSFKINKDGNIKNIAARAPHPDLEKETKRVLSLLPKMVPGYQRGKPVIVPYSLPIVFTIQ